MDGYEKSSIKPDGLRESLARPVEGWPELQAGFAPVDIVTGEKMIRVTPDTESARRAAVLVPVVISGSKPEIVYTLRKPDLSDHAGQISFPGGSREDSDDSLLETALREASEEIDLPPELVEVVGELEDMYIPPSNFLVKPFVGTLSEEAEFRMEPDEVAEILTVPLDILLNPATFRRTTLERDGRTYGIPVFHVEANGRTHEIWGATAAITADFLSRLGWKIPA